MTRPSFFVLATCAALAMTAGPVLAQNGSLRKVAPDNLSHYWVRTNTHVDAQAPNSGRGLDKIGCAAVTYTIGSDGATRNIKVAKKVPSTSDFQVTATSLVRGLHYRAASGNKNDQPVRTYFIVPFNVPNGDQATMQKVLKSCHLPGYGQ